MLIAAFGAPTPFFNLCRRLVVAIMALDGMPQIEFGTNEFEKFREQLLQRETRNVFFHSSAPDADIVNILIRNRITCVVFVEETVSAIDAIRISHNLDYMNALRVYSAHFAALDPIAFQQNHANLIAEKTLGDDPFALVEAIAKAINVILDRDRAESVLLGVGYNPDRHSIFDLVWSDYSLVPKRPVELNYSQKDIDAIDLTFPPVDKIAERGLSWSPRFFYAGDDQHFADEVIELTGKARPLIFGPFFFIAKGTWRVTYHLNVVKNGSGNTLLADIQSNLVVLAVGKVKLPAEGSVEFSLDFKVPNANSRIEVRIQTIEGAIDGFIELVSVKLTRI